MMVGVHDRALAQQQAAAGEVGVDRREQLPPQRVALQQVAEVQDRALVGNRLGQREAAEAPRRLGLVEEVLHGRGAEVVADLHHVDATT